MHALAWGLLGLPQHQKSVLWSLIVPGCGLGDALVCRPGDILRPSTTEPKEGARVPISATLAPSPLVTFLTSHSRRRPLVRVFLPSSFKCSFPSCSSSS